MKHLENVRTTMTPRSTVLLAVALLGTGFTARAYRRRKKQLRPGLWHANHALVKARRACGIDAQRRCIRRQVSGPSPFLLVGVWTHPPYNTVAYAAMKACAPAKPAAPVVSGTSGSTTSLDESWTAPAIDGKPAIDNYDLRYRQGTSGNWTDGPQDRTGTSATIGSLDSDTEYQVRVRASNDEGDGDWSGRNRGEVSEKCPRTRSLPARATAM